jgi:hypothetical protein
MNELRDELREVCGRLRQMSNALSVLLLSEEGQELVRVGTTGALDVSSRALLEATGGMARLRAERELMSQLGEKRETRVHLSLVAGRAILAVVFDAGSSLGLVRLRVKAAAPELARILARSPSEPGSAAPAQAPLYRPGKTDKPN